MRHVRRGNRGGLLACGLAGLAALAWTNSAPAQGMTSGRPSTTGGTTSSRSAFSTGSGLGGSLGGSGLGSSLGSGGFSGGTFGQGGGFAGQGGTFGQGGATGGAALGSGGLTNLGGGGGAVATSNPFRSYYINPYSMGMPGTTTGTGTARQGTFGQPLYNTTTTGQANTLLGGAGRLTGAGGAGIAGIGRVGAGAADTTAFASSAGTRRSLTYTTEIALDPPPPAAAPPPGPPPLMTRMRTEVAQVVARSSALPSRGNINVVMEDDVVVLRGAVVSERERRFAEGLVRTTPGVREVRNELEVRPQRP